MCWCFDVACERREESKMTKLSSLSNWRMEWGYVELGILSNNQRRHQVSSCVYDSRVQGRILGEYMNVGVTGPRVRWPRVWLYAQKKVQSSGWSIMKLLEDKEEPTKKTGKQGLQRKEERQANTHLGSQGKTVSGRRLSSTAWNSAYRSPKMKVKEDSWLDLIKRKSLVPLVREVSKEWSGASPTGLGLKEKQRRENGHSNR